MPRRKTDASGIASLYEAFKFHHDSLKNRSALRKELNATGLQHIKITRKPLRRRQKGSKLLLNKWEMNIPRVRTSGRFEKEPKQKKVEFISKLKSKVIVKTMPKRTTYKKKRTYKRKTRVPKRIPSGFPDSKLVKLHSNHLISMDPAANAVTSYGCINLNNPIDPFNNSLDTADFTMISTEHHPQHWTEFSSVYNKYRVVSTMVHIKFLNPNATGPHAYFAVPVSEASNGETKTILDDTQLFSVRIKEVNKRAQVKFRNGGNALTNNGSNASFVVKQNIAKLEGISNATDPSLQGSLGGDLTETAATVSPKLYFGMGSLVSSNNMVQLSAIVRIEYMILFSDKETTEGAAV